MDFNKLGVMIDCSRNAVMTVPALKQFISLLAKMGYNQVHLYMEDTYAVTDEPHFGYLRGKYAKAELKELDDFAYGLGVELVPNIQTLAHMTAFVRWRKDIVDTNDILLVDEEKTYDLIRRMFQDLRECFRTTTLHIGMDEAHMLGRGKFYDLHGPEDRFDILLRHLQKVCEMAKQQGFMPMMWSDMFYRLANNGAYYQASSQFDPSIKSRIPEDLTLVYWDYYSHDKKRYDRMIAGHRQLCDRLAFAGGARKWSGFAPQNYYSIKAHAAALPACRNGGIRDVFITLWGDDGAECSSFSVLPTLCHAACLAQGITKPSQIKAKFQEWVGAKYEDLLLLDSPNLLEPTDEAINPCKYFLYADCFMSVFQNTEKPEYGETYAATARKLKRAAKRAGEYAYLFETLATLCDVLSIKVDICTRTRQAYASGDNAQLDEVLGRYTKMIKLTEKFYKAFRKQWYTENKPNGFEVQDLRLGGLMQRMAACRDRLTDYRTGTISSIPELEEPIVPFTEGLGLHNNWHTSVSTSVI